MHSTETEREYLGGIIQTDKSRLDRELNELNHLQQLISEDKVKILGNEKKYAELTLAVGKAKKDLEDREISRAKLNEMWQTLQRHLDKYHQAEEQTKMTVMQDKTALKKNVDIK